MNRTIIKSNQTIIIEEDEELGTVEAMAKHFNCRLAPKKKEEEDKENICENTLFVKKGSRLRPRPWQ